MAVLHDQLVLRLGTPSITLNLMPDRFGHQIFTSDLLTPVAELVSLRSKANTTR